MQNKEQGSIDQLNRIVHVCDVHRMHYYLSLKMLSGTTGRFFETIKNN